MLPADPGGLANAGVHSAVERSAGVSSGGWDAPRGFWEGGRDWSWQFMKAGFPNQTCLWSARRSGVPKLATSLSP